MFNFNQQNDSAEDEKGYLKFLAEMGLPDNFKSRAEYQQYKQIMQTGKAPTIPTPERPPIPEISEPPEVPDNKNLWQQGVDTQRLFNEIQNPGYYNREPDRPYSGSASTPAPTPGTPPKLDPWEIRTSDKPVGRFEVPKGFKYRRDMR